MLRRMKYFVLEVARNLLTHVLLAQCRAAYHSVAWCSHSLPQHNKLLPWGHFSLDFWDTMLDDCSFSVWFAGSFSLPQPFNLGSPKKAHHLLLSNYDGLYLSPIATPDIWG
jgi:hypothetical protein